MRHLHKTLALLCTLALAIGLSGCITINNTGSFQAEPMGSVTLSVTGCATGSPGCSGSSNNGSLFGFLEGPPSSDEDFDIQVLLAVRLPNGSTPPDNLVGNLAGGGTLAFARSPSYEVELQTLEPAPAGERWWGWISGVFNYSRKSKQSFEVSLTATLPRPADGGPFESPMHWRPVLGARSADPPLLSTRPVICGSNNKELYEGINESSPNTIPPTVICVDSPSPDATRGFLGAVLTDFGILGTAVQVPAGSTVTAPFIAKRSGPPIPGTTFTLTAQSAVPNGPVSIDRTTVLLSGDAIQPVLATINVPADTKPGSYPITLTATAPGRPTRTGTVTVTVPGVPGKAPVLTASLTRKRFRAKGKPSKGATPVGTKLKVTLSEAATVSIAVSRQGKKSKSLGTIKKPLKAGENTITIRRRIGKIKLTPGRYRLTLAAQNSAGLTSEAKTLTFKVVGD